MGSLYDQSNFNCIKNCSLTNNLSNYTTEEKQNVEKVILDLVETNFNIGPLQQLKKPTSQYKVE
jgi:hypothetical protein